jgi:putative NIF3 family GTP cyclohydrolase 1 type 2
MLQMFQRSMLKVQNLVGFIDALLRVEEQPDDPAGVYTASDAEIKRLGLMLEPTADISECIAANSLNALFLHRPWKLHQQDLTVNFGVIAYHRAFDNLLGVCFNPFLANDLQIHNVEEFAYKDGSPLGMVGDVETQTWEETVAKIEAQFDGYEAVTKPQNTTVKRIAVVGAMNDATVREAVERGADIYLTGQMRVPAKQAVAETGIGVITTGHARGELWGLHKLAFLLEQEFPELETLVYTKSVKRSTLATPSKT